MTQIIDRRIFCGIINAANFYYVGVYLFLSTNKILLVDRLLKGIDSLVLACTHYPLIKIINTAVYIIYCVISASLV